MSTSYATVSNSFTSLYLLNTYIYGRLCRSYLKKMWKQIRLQGRIRDAQHLGLDRIFNLCAAKGSHVCRKSLGEGQK
jgi:hypothetical protein